ncbi:MAG: choice-of-anchor L domain-containing protein [Paracoccaceae bacterium]|nr:choice-of-anchor L domain-containing protein [Paracoccaceae bacterium]MDG1736411.1 choice-of-anchor L domain-containing protein [Paracoccaceae bacterium]MDG2257726.1 choice-of-anchor L domain-containing protein [Paracoccaceae bacterium]
MPKASELPIDTKASASEMAEAIFGDGIKIENASYSGSSKASGIFSNGDSVASDITPSDTGVILSTGKASSVTNSKGDVNTRSNTSTNNRTSGDKELDELSGVKTYNAATIEAEFVPDGDTLTMQVVFSSEEYLEYCGTGFNDAVGIWVNGTPAELTVGDGDITINNINDTSNANLYVDNHHNDDVANTEMDGFTVTLTLKAPVIAGETNTIKISIADGGDGYYDSNLLIAGDSVQCALVAGDDEVDINGLAATGVDVLSNDGDGGSLTITHINGQPVVAGETVSLPSGETVTLNADGTFDILSDGDEDTNIFSYTIQDDLGNTDTAFVTVSTTPCFVAGTLIRTPNGQVLVENLQAGDIVSTRDHGPRMLLWVGQTLRRAIGKDAPIVFESGVLGQHSTVAFSPNHRVLVKSPYVEMLFEKDEMLVKASHLVNGATIRRSERLTKVTYCHLLFDQHEIVFANELESESYHPGNETLGAFDTITRDEVLALFPQLSSASYGPTARACLKAHEGRLLSKIGALS